LVVAAVYDVPETIEISGVIRILYTLRERITQIKHHSSLHSISVLQLAGFGLNLSPDTSCRHLGSS